MVNFDAKHFYKKGKVSVDANGTIKYYSNTDKPENYYDSFTKFEQNPVNLRTKDSYTKPYPYYFICNERHLTGS